MSRTAWQGNSHESRGSAGRGHCSIKPIETNQHPLDLENRVIAEKNGQTDSDRRYRKSYDFTCRRRRVIQFHTKTGGGHGLRRLAQWLNISQIKQVLRTQKIGAAGDRRFAGIRPRCWSARQSITCATDMIGGLFSVLSLYFLKGAAHIAGVAGDSVEFDH